MGKPLVTAAIHRFEGQAMTYVPEQGPCYRCLFAEADDSVVPNCAEAGVLGVLPGVLGTIQATEAIKLILGAGSALTRRLLTFDALQMQFQEFHFERRRNCDVCGDTPTITELKDKPMPADTCSPTVRRLDVSQVREQILQGGSDAAPLALIDVREPWEFESGHLEDAVNIPLGELPMRLDEIPPRANAIFVCRSGARSLAACHFAVQAGISAPANLEGGMLAWDASL
jgi:adenylyltransferase/sulfurtransferase